MNAPIGVFDSGIGGLTVVRALRECLPQESLIYVGDTARVPYGPKSPDTVRRYADQITGWLVEQQVKAIVVACNTATAHALSHLQSTLSVPVIGVIEPGAKAAVAASRNQVIGVIGTSGTIASRAYDEAILRRAPSARVITTACPLLVPLVEEGWTTHPATHLIIAEYLQTFADTDIDTLVLGCTHYPLLSAPIQQHIGASVQLIDSAEETAQEVRRVLLSRQLEADATPSPVQRFIATDAPERFHALGRRFLGDAMAHVEHVAFT